MIDWLAQLVGLHPRFMFSSGGTGGGVIQVRVCEREKGSYWHVIQGGRTDVIAGAQTLNMQFLYASSYTLQNATRCGLGQ